MGEVVVITLGLALGIMASYLTGLGAVSLWSLTSLRVLSQSFGPAARG